MRKIEIMTITATISALLLFLPEILPRCSICGRYKPRLFFRIHKTVGVKPGYSSYRSACKKCCMRFNIHGMFDFEAVYKIRKGIRSRLDPDR